jgi:hypothetical protein
MSWPAWTEALKERFLADEASAFLVVGDIHAKQWMVEGESLDAANVLVRLLARSRPVVGVMRTGVAGGLRFPTFADEKKFDELVDAAMLLSGAAVALSAREPMEALGRIWQALNTVGHDQAYMVVDVDNLLPRRRKRIDPIPTAPALSDWPAHPTLRKSNNIVVFLTTSEEAVRPELVQACSVIRLDGTPVLDEATAVALEHLQEDVTSPAAADPPAPQGGDVEAPAAAPLPTAGFEALIPLLEKALVQALLDHPEEHRPKKLPVMKAVADVMELGGAGWHGLRFSLDDEGEVVVEGQGGDDFLAMWRADIALDAAGGMMLKALTGGFSATHPPDLDETAMRALSKRVAKKLR